jgi:hypothetical protein
MWGQVLHFSILQAGLHKTSDRGQVLHFSILQAGLHKMLKCKT